MACSNYIAHTDDKSSHSGHGQASEWVLWPFKFGIQTDWPGKFYPIDNKLPKERAKSRGLSTATGIFYDKIINRTVQ